MKEKYHATLLDFSTPLLLVLCLQLLAGLVFAAPGPALGSSTVASSMPGFSCSDELNSCTLYPTADALITNAEEATNYGQNDSKQSVSYANIHSDEQGAFALLRFDLSSLPAHSIIDLAYSGLYLETAAALATPVSMTPYGITTIGQKSQRNVETTTHDCIPPFFVSTPCHSTPGYKQFDLSGFARSWYNDSTTNYGK